jgi:alpha-amylase
MSRPSARLASRLGAAALLTLAAAAAPSVRYPARAAGSAARASGPGRASLTAAGGDGAIVQMFDWPWTAIASECTNVLGPDGYGAVQISPPQEAVVLASSGYPWWQAYQPVSYQLGSRFGTEAQLAAMIQACHAAGVKVYADVVLNHMTGQGGGGTGDDGTTFPDKYDYPPLYSAADFHTCQTSITDWDDESQVWNCQLDGLADLDTGSAYVRSQEADYLNSLISLGVDGFRWDAAKEMDPADISAIESLLSKPVFVYQEVPWGAGQPVTPDLYEGTGDVMEFRYGWDLNTVFTSGDLASLADFGPSFNSSGMIPGSGAVVFVDNQDTERDGSMLDYADGANYTLANVFMLAWDYGTPEVMSDYAFSGYDQGPPSAGGNAISAPACGGSTGASGSGGWECEQRWPAIAGMVGWRGAAGSAPVQNWWSDGSNAIAFSRGSSAFVAINKESSPVSETFTTGLPAGVYCDVIGGALSGGACTGRAVTVTASGQATITVPPDDAVALDVDAVATGSTETVNVTVPSGTAATGDQVYLAGNLSALGEGGTDWAPAGVPMSQVSPAEWTATLTSPGSPAGSATLSYKYDLGGSWANVEETSSCGYVANRTLTMENGTTTDTVANWAGFGGC